MTALSEHMKFHISRINTMIAFFLNHRIKSFAYGYDKEKFNNDDYWEVITYYQKTVNADNNDKFIFFYEEDEYKRLTFKDKVSPAELKKGVRKVESFEKVEENDV